MDQRNIIIICTILVIGIIGITTYLLLDLQEDTSIELLNNTVVDGENIELALWIDNEHRLKNKNITLTITDDAGNSTKYSIVTDNQGIARMKINLNPDKKWKISAEYAGEWRYESSKLNEIDLIVKSQDTIPSIVNTANTNKLKSNTEDPFFEKGRDESHRYATKEHPITVQQSDGEYVYYGPGHFDYYAGDNHMSGSYYKQMYDQYKNP